MTDSRSSPRPSDPALKGELRLRDEILRAVSYAAGRFLRTSDVEARMADVLAKLGTATRVSRVYVFQNKRGEDGTLLADQRFEWTAEHAPPQAENPELHDVPYEEAGFDRWAEILSRGVPVEGHVEEFPPDEQALLEAQDIVSLLVVPIFVGDRWWGFMGLDECRERRQWPDVILEALRTAADTIGTAIHRRDTDEALRRTESELERMAFHDALTGLPNRRLFQDRLEHALERAVRDETGVAVLHLGIDRFKVVNDALGHAAGDRLLARVADRLVEVVRPADTVARLAGDEFGVLLEDGGVSATAEETWERIASSLSAPFDVAGNRLDVTASAGVAVSRPGAERSADDLLRFGAVALHRAKESRSGRLHVFDPAADLERTSRLRREIELREAIEGRAFRLHYQPVVEMGDGRVVGLEALVRWHRPDGDLLRPGEFIPLAEGSGLIVPLGEWILEEACRQAAAWHDRRPELTMAVNLSPRQLRDPGIVGTVESALESHRLPASRLQLEVTESVALEETSRLAALRSLGVGLAIDDFGTGYATLTYLKNLQADVLKIDRSFTAALVEDTADRAIVRAIVGVTRDLGLEAVAEGVETERQAELLMELGCRRAQGFHFARPAPAEEIEDFLDE